MASLRPLIPRASLYLHSKQLQHRLCLPSIRHASTTPPPKPRVLEKPERFNPPSHPSRLRTKPRQYPGPPLSEHERKAQTKRKYPHMMPPEGTFMHWFLTSRALHTWITLVSPQHTIQIHPQTKHLTNNTTPERPHIPGPRRLVDRLHPHNTLPRPAPAQQHVPRPPLRVPPPLLGSLRPAYRARVRSHGGEAEAES